MIAPRTPRRRKSRRLGYVAAEQVEKPATTAVREPLPSPAVVVVATPQIDDIGDLTRVEIMAQLDDLGIVYSKRAPRAVLASSLWGALMTAP